MVIMAPLSRMADVSSVVGDMFWTIVCTKLWGGGGDAVSSSELWSELGGVGILFEEVELVCWSVGVVALLCGRARAGE